MATPIIGKELKNEKLHVGSLNHLVGGLIHITVQTCYDLQYLTIRLSGYLNTLTESAFIAIKHCMGYLMHHPYEPIMYSRNKIHIPEESPHQCYFKAGDSGISKNYECSNFLHTYFDENHARDISYRLSVTSTVHLFNGNINSLKQQESVQMKKQEECTQGFYIKTVSETSLDQLVIPYDLHQNSMRTTKQQLKEYYRIESLPNPELVTL